jgi:hypothetical protein
LAPDDRKHLDAEVSAHRRLDRHRDDRVGGSAGIYADLNSGGRYDPVNDNLVATSMGAMVPEQRLAHTTIWTGAEMIVWGGTPSGTIPPDRRE